MVVIPASFRFTNISSPTITIFLNESFTFLNEASSCSTTSTNSRYNFNHVIVARFNKFVQVNGSLYLHGSSKLCYM